jgi:hypothetical protein
MLRLNFQFANLFLIVILQHKNKIMRFQNTRSYAQND